MRIHWFSRSSRIVALCSAANFINSADRVIMPIAIVPMTDQFNWSLHAQGWILSAFACGYFTSQLLGTISHTLVVVTFMVRFLKNRTETLCCTKANPLSIFKYMPFGCKVSDAPSRTVDKPWGKKQNTKLSVLRSRNKGFGYFIRHTLIYTKENFIEIKYKKGKCLEYVYKTLVENGMLQLKKNVYNVPNILLEI